MNPAQASDQAVSLFRQGRLAEALALLDGAARDNPGDVAPLLLKGRMLASARRGEDALACFRAVLAAHPDLTEAWNEQGVLLADLKHHDEALTSYDRAIALQPGLAEVFYNRGNSLRELKREQQAVESFDRALALNPGFFQAWNNRGSALHALNRPADAVESFDKVLAIEPRIAETWNNRGLALMQAECAADALESHERALALDKQMPSAWDGRGAALRALGRQTDALASHEQALALDPALASAWVNRGNVLRDLRRLAEALESFDRAIQLHPGDAQAWINRGVVLRDMKNISAALESYGRAIMLDPQNAAHFYSRGLVAWVENHDYDAALADMERAVALDPDCPNALGGLLLVRQYGGDWRNFDATVARIDAGVRAGKEVVEPFVYQAVSHAPADLQACSTIHARAHYPAQPPLARTARAPGKIRVGYVSGEFREQATAYLMAGLYERHDKARFTITAYDNGGSDNSAMRRRLETAFDNFVDIRGLSDRGAAERIARDGTDILVNLNGYFGDHRMGVFAHHPTPIQVNYLGFPATLGAAYMDYILADRIVIPEGERRFYTEQVAYLPHCYQANDGSRPPVRDIPARATLGLPDDAFVFCNFNAGYKLVPESFGGWIRILRQTPGSVLWLLEGDPHFTRNLRQAAKDAGIEPGRLIFAPMTDQARHLARMAAADLFLDGLPYNAHTTASDALWAGLPLLTCRGTAFPGRVAASLLAAIGLPELTVENGESFERSAIALARDPAKLATLRAKLNRNRFTTPLFDTAGFTRSLEAAYETMLAKWQDGEPPESFAAMS